MAKTLNQKRLLGLIKRTGKTEGNIDLSVLGKKVGFLTKFFGCVHKNISRPFVSGKISYRTCLQCGARKQFNTETFETFGSFYYPLAEKLEINKFFEI